MKKILLTLVAAISALAVNAETQRVMKVSLSDGSEAKYVLSEVEEVTFADEEIVEEEDDHEYVDLGLESGTLWATMNVGAETVTDYGDYFAWGETEAKETYSKDTYSFYDSETGSYTKYYNDDLTTLELADDAANVIWGSDWRMPTIDELNELKNNCTWTWTDNYEESGVAGYVVKGTNGNSIFLPAAGYRNASSLNYAGSDGYYWSSSLDSSYPNSAQYLNFDSGYFSSNLSYRYYGQSVRPVRSASE